MVKTMWQIFDEWLEEVLVLVDDENYASCGSMTSERISTFCFADFEDGVLVAEVLEAVFLQLNHVCSEHDIDDKFRKNIHDTIKDDLVRIQQAHDNKENMYDALKKIRYNVTQHQLSLLKFVSLMKKNTLPLKE